MPERYKPKKAEVMLAQFEILESARRKAVTDYQEYARKTHNNDGSSFRTLLKKMDNFVSEVASLELSKEQVSLLSKIKIELTRMKKEEEYSPLFEAACGLLHLNMKNAAEC